MHRSLLTSGFKRFRFTGSGTKGRISRTGVPASKLLQIDRRHPRNLQQIFVKCLVRSTYIKWWCVQPRLLSSVSHHGLNIWYTCSRKKKKQLTWHIGELVYRLSGTQDCSQGCDTVFFVFMVQEVLRYTVLLLVLVVTVAKYCTFSFFSKNNEMKHRRFSYSASRSAPTCRDTTPNVTAMPVPFISGVVTLGLPNVRRGPRR